MSEPFFGYVTESIDYEGPETDNPLAFRFYDADQVVMGLPMREHLRAAVCYWHSFCWPGSDVFGAGTFDRPWVEAAMGDPMAAARHKMAAAFEFFEKLGLPYFCFHDVDLAPEGTTFKESARNLDELADEVGERMDDVGVGLLWGTANLFSHPRYAAGAATNPDPEIFAYAAAQVCQMLETTHRLGGENYVLWGGREGYETLLNTDLKQEADQLARFLRMVAEHKHRIGFRGTLLIEPKPAEPAKHQYDFDSASVHGFLDRYDLVDEYKVNLEVNHATLGGHSFHHEVAYAAANGILGSIDANRGDPQNGWDTDQFPNSVEEMTLGMVEILGAGGLGSGGFNFDTKLRRQSLDRSDLFHGHIGGIDTLARSLIAAASIVEDGTLQDRRADRYAGWDDPLGVSLMKSATLAELLDRANSGAFDDAVAVSGGQEALENLVNRHIYPG